MVNRLTLGSGLLLPGLLSAFIAITAMTVTGQDKKSKENEKSMAIYADAANFLNAGKYELSIEEWGKFLKDYPKDPLAGKAAHYLGVSLMQKEKPDYVSAAKQFDKALDFKGFDMREEALANRATWQLAMQAWAKPLS